MDAHCSNLRNIPNVSNIISTRGFPYIDPKGSLISEIFSIPPKMCQITILLTENAQNSALAKI